jgi:hypothetical protein
MIRLQLTAVCIGLLIASTTLSAARVSTPQLAASPAEWSDHDMLVELHNLPQAYTCQQLWYKFRDVLSAIGAGPSPEVTPLRCNSRSPEVQVRFSYPRVLHGKFERYATVQAMSSTVELRPGYPSHLKASDCSLVEQLDETMFRDLSIRVLSADLPCRVSRAPIRPFNVALETLRVGSEAQSALVHRARHGSHATSRSSREVTGSRSMSPEEVFGQSISLGALESLKLHSLNSSYDSLTAPPASTDGIGLRCAPLVGSMVDRAGVGGTQVTGLPRPFSDETNKERRSFFGDATSNAQAIPAPTLSCFSNPLVMSGALSRENQ